MVNQLLVASPCLIIGSGSGQAKEVNLYPTLEVVVGRRVVIHLPG